MSSKQSARTPSVIRGRLVDDAWLVVLGHDRALLCRRPWCMIGPCYAEGLYVWLVWVLGQDRALLWHCVMYETFYCSTVYNVWILQEQVSVNKVAGQWTVQCLIDIKVNANVTNNLVGLLDGNGHPVSNIADATAISYSLCTSFCGSGPFQWPVLSQDFSSWLLPSLALVSQLPFGAEERLDSQAILS
jgi:hypothetical protein